METLEFCSSSIRHRFSRSLLTLAVMALAVAFFMYLQCDHLFRERIRAGVAEEIQRNRSGARLASWLFASYNTPQEFLRSLAAADPSATDSFGKFFGMQNEERSRFFQTVRNVVVFDTFCHGIPTGKLQRLFEKDAGKTGVEQLSGMPVDELIRRSRSLGIRLPLATEDLARLASDYPAFRNRFLKAYARWGALQKDLQSYAEISEMNAGRKFLLALTPEEEEKTIAFLAEKGFSPEKEHWRRMKQDLRVQNAKERLSAYLAQPEVRKKWRSAFGAGRYIKLDEKLCIMDRAECASFAGDLSDAERREVAKSTRQTLELNRLEDSFALGNAAVPVSDRSRQVYLMVLAFLVCVIGITNAMLMSITERFSEIATLKCLGATDLFILVQIVFEAMLQGVAGGVLGIFLGLGAATCGNLLHSGFRLFGAWDWFSLSGASLYAIAAGILLAMLSAIYPAVKAARMAPMEAMRVQ